MTIKRSLSAGSCLLLALVFSFSTPARAQKPADTACCLSALQVDADTSVELLVTAPIGLKTGYDPVTGQHVDQIPSSNYYSQAVGDNSGEGGLAATARRISIEMPEAGEYTVQAIGLTTGSFTLKITGIDSKGALSSRKFTGKVSPGATFVYMVRYSPAPGSKIDITPLVPFSSLSANVNVAAGPPPTFSVTGTFAPGAAPSAIDPVTQPVSFHLAGYSVTIPPGSFKRTGEGVYTFDGTVDGVPLRMQIVPQSGGNFGFSVKAQNIVMTAAINPLRLLLILGNNAGAKLVNAVTQ